MDLVKLLQDVLASPITAAITAVVAFVLGLVARPVIEARTGIFRESTSARREFQRQTLTEVRDLLHAIDPGFDGRVDDARDFRRLRIVARQIADDETRRVVQRFVELDDRWEAEQAFESTTEMVGAALRRL
jgi:hypothetical protein